MLKSVFESELVQAMHGDLIKQATNQNHDQLDQAVEHLHSAMDIFDSKGLYSKSNRILNVLEKIAKSNNPKKPHLIPNGHNTNLTSEQMVENLKRHGTPFNMADTALSDDDLLDQDINDLSFEDEVDQSDHDQEETF